MFLLGIWKDFEQMEKSLSMPELLAIQAAKNDRDISDRQFQASLQGAELQGAPEQEDPNKAWEDMKARVFSGGKAKDSNDIVSLQGQNAVNAGFGIGMGLEYEVV